MENCPILGGCAMSIVAVAKKAGVSVSTVARVLKGLPAVSDKTAKQVRKAMSELGYKRTPVRRVKAGVVARSAGQYQIAILSLAGDANWHRRPDNAKAVQAIMDAAKQRGIEVTLGEPTSPQLKQVHGGIVFVPPDSDEVVLKDLAAKLPLVCIMSAEPCQVRVDHVVTDAGEIGRLAFDYMRSKGCDRFAFLSDGNDLRVAELQGQGFAQAVSRTGKTPELQFVSSKHSRMSVTQGYVHRVHSVRTAIESLCSKGGKIGLFLPSTGLSQTACRELAGHGRKLGSDAVVVSCTNEEANATDAVPTIEPQWYIVGRLALQQLLHRIAHPSAPAVRVQVPALLRS